MIHGFKHISNNIRIKIEQILKQHYRSRRSRSDRIPKQALDAGHCVFVRVVVELKLIHFYCDPLRCLLMCCVAWCCTWKLDDWVSSIYVRWCSKLLHSKLFCCKYVELSCDHVAASKMDQNVDDDGWEISVAMSCFFGDECWSYWITRSLL